MAVYTLAQFFPTTALKWFLLVLFLVYTIVAGIKTIRLYRNIRSESDRIIRSLNNLVDDIQADLGICKRDIRNLSNVEKFLENPECDEGLRIQFQQLVDNSNACYSSQWIATPERFFTSSRVYGDILKKYFVPDKMLIVLTLGLLLSCFFSIFAISAGNDVGVTSLPYIVFPLAFSIGAYGLVRSEQKLRRNDIDDALDRFNIVLNNSMPVFDSKVGTVLMIKNIESNEENFCNGLEELNKTMQEFLNKDFIEKLANSVGMVLEDKLVPQVRKAEETTNRLEKDINAKQKQQMSDLAQFFVRELNSTVNKVFEPLRKQIEDFSLKNSKTIESMESAQKGLNEFITSSRESVQSFLSSSKNMIDESYALNNKVNEELVEINREICNSRLDFNSYIKEISVQVRLLSKTSNDLSAILIGERGTLVESINKLTGAMDESYNKLQECLNMVMNSVNDINRLKDEVEKGNQDNSLALSEACKSFDESSENLIRASKSFTSKSDTILQNTADNLDKITADVIERLIFTTSALRDAVEKLALSVMIPDKNNN